ncbi:hypothetical protein KP509_01G087300 [Ceratopteris richardii]|uniref:Uncharacterized protein n=1 Tax=Ceratopteris richardii TaxID=49495 RepID=A0A8T2VN69_CERRI|nr:hypothetical protein KP509_01G087300 [Ceratopteris richardii]KAH7447014.1 hypothetical protein KP509_01G087300 [Ceratopteris richardii]
MHRLTSFPAWGRPGFSINGASSVNTQTFSSRVSRKGGSSPCFPSFRGAPSASQIFRLQDYIEPSSDSFSDDLSSSFSSLTWKSSLGRSLTKAIPTFSTHHEHKSPDSGQEPDLDDLIIDYFENSTSRSNTVSGENLGETRTCKDSQYYQILQELFLEASSFEDEILRAINRIIFSIKDRDFRSFTCSLNCGGGCVRRIIVKHLQLLKFDAEVRRSKWPKFDKVPAGEYEYIDVISQRGTNHADRLIVDIDFRSQFEIARPTQSYIDLTACLPVIFVGSAEKLSQVLRIFAEEAKLSLKNNNMYVSPWRSLSYMRCKWLYPLERSHKQTRVTNQGPVGHVQRGAHTGSTGNCMLQLDVLKMCCSSNLGRSGLHHSSITT